MPDEILYCYAIVASGTSSMDAGALRDVRGVAGAPVEAVPEERLAALVSPLPAPEWSPENVEARSADISWLGEQAVAHDRVVTWASDRGAVIPLPVLSFFADAARVRSMLASRGPELLDTLERVSGAREYGLRLTRNDAVLASRLAGLSEQVAALERNASSASPGQAFLLRRKLEARRRDELQRVSADLVQDLHDALAVHARSVVIRPVPSTTQEHPVVLDAAYLVADESLESFREALTHQLELRVQDGFAADFTGPWPPYHFVRRADEDTAGGTDDA